MSPKYLIVAPPPTPNGDLHVGHISGPYLAADIYKRYLAQWGIKAVYTISTDDHQTYVDTMAESKGLSPDVLIADSRAAIRESLHTYAIGLDYFGHPDEEYCNYVGAFFAALLQAGLIEARLVDVLFDVQNNTYPVEAFISGLCPHCFDSSCGGVCESCGHPNNGVELLEIDRERYQTRQECRIILDLEKFRPELDEFLCSMPTHRPALKRLIRELLAARLNPFVLSYVAPRGISTAFAGIPSQRLNVWGEMFPGHIYFLEKAAAPISSKDRYVQFFGFDNSYFYAIVHVALLIAARKCGFDWPSPSAFVTNQFYNLEAPKFSKSKGHAIWARDLAKEFNPDLVRLFLALHGPEFQEANFVKALFADMVEGLAATFNRLAGTFNSFRSKACCHDSQFPAAITKVMAEPCDWDQYASGVIARRSMNIIDFMQRAIAHGDFGLISWTPIILVLCVEVFCPQYAQLVRDTFSIKTTCWRDRERTRPDRDLPLMELRR